MKDLIKFIAQILVDNPEHVSVTEIRGKQTEVLKLNVDRGTFYKFIKIKELSDYRLNRLKSLRRKISMNN